MKTFFNLAVGVVMGLASVSAVAHASLQSSTPSANEVVQIAPTAIVLRFDTALEAPFSKITLINLKTGAVDTRKALGDRAHPNTLRTPMPPLAAGNYQVQWSTLTQDGHRAKGQFSFQVK